MRAGTIGLVVVGLAVLILVGSLVLGMRGEAGGGAAAVAADGATTRVRVEVLNAAGVPGLARLATERLRDAGFDVVYFGNARAFGPDTSLVLDRVGNADAASGVARALEISRVDTRPDTTLFLEVTVVLGRDWVGIPPAPRSEPADSAAGD